MHFSDDENNFRNRRYLDACERHFKKMFASYYAYMSYHGKLTDELTMKQEEREELKELDRKLVKNLMNAYELMKKRVFLMTKSHGIWKERY